MNTKILELALKGMDKETLIANINDIVMNIGEHPVTDTLLFGMPKVTDIDIKRYCLKYDYAYGFIGDIDIIDAKVNPIEHQVTVRVEYNCIRYTNICALNRFIGRKEYDKKREVSYKGFVYWDDISNTLTDKNNIPFFTKVEETYYISLDNDCVTYTR